MKNDLRYPEAFPRRGRVWNQLSHGVAAIHLFTFDPIITGPGSPTTDGPDTKGAYLSLFFQHGKEKTQQNKKKRNKKHENGARSHGTGFSLREHFGACVPHYSTFVSFLEWDSGTGFWGTAFVFVHRDCLDGGVIATGCFFSSLLGKTYEWTGRETREWVLLC